jgi:hypothetical protein
MLGSEPNFLLTAVKREFATFKNKQHSFGDIDVIASSKELAAHEWWDIECDDVHYPWLRKLSVKVSKYLLNHIKVFYEIVSTCIIHHQFRAIYGLTSNGIGAFNDIQFGKLPEELEHLQFVHSKLRNRLIPQRANKLVYCHYNLHLAKKVQQPEKFAEWHGGEDMDI